MGKSNVRNSSREQTRFVSTRFVSKKKTRFLNLVSRNFGKSCFVDTRIVSTRFMRKKKTRFVKSRFVKFWKNSFCELWYREQKQKLIL